MTSQPHTDQAQPSPSRETPCGFSDKLGESCILAPSHEGDHDVQRVLVSAHQITAALLDLRADFIRASARLEVVLQQLTDAVGGCIHPMDRRRFQGAFKWPQRFKCMECGNTFNGPALGRKQA